MAFITKASLFLVSATIARLASATNLYVFPNSDCDKSGYYNTIYTSEGTCSSTITSGDDNFQKVGNTSDVYQSWALVDEQLDHGCGVVIGQGSGDGVPPACGSCILLLHNAGQCVEVDIKADYFSTQCCGQECQNLCSQIPGKRTLGETTEAPEAKEAETAKTTPDIGNLKNRSPVSSLKKRSDCKFSQSGGLYSQVGAPVKVSPTYNTCPSENGCSNMYSGTIESSFSQGFDVSESTEAGLFKVVSETVTFGYSATWEESKSSTVQSSVTFNQGQSGFITFSPLSQCTRGTFSGADCDGMGIPAGGDPRAACVPEILEGGLPNGDINVVTVA